MEAMEQRLIEAAITGDVNLLDEIVSRGLEIILDKYVAGCSDRNPLHVAASFGQTQFARGLLSLRPRLAEVLDAADLSALHLAAATGAVDVAKILIEVAPEMCMARDREGRNPVHVAAVKGKVEMLAVLVEANPCAALTRVDRDGTILHLCVKYRQRDSLKKLLEMIGKEELINAKDADGNTVLHLAVSCSECEMVKEILDSKEVHLDATNANGRSAMDLALVSERHSRAKHDIKVLLKKLDARRGKDLAKGEWVTERREAMMVMASLVATMAFQVAMNPPGGVWQDDSDTHKVGEAVMAYSFPHSYPWFVRIVTVGFFASMSAMMLLLSGLPISKRRYRWLVLFTMWMAITAMAAAYAICIRWVTPEVDRNSVIDSITVAVLVLCTDFAIFTLVHIAYLIYGSIRELNIGRVAR